MATALDNRPLLVRLQARILKKQGGKMLSDVDITLNQQSIHAIEQLLSALESLTGETPSPSEVEAARQLIIEHRGTGLLRPKAVKA